MEFVPMEFVIVLKPTKEKIAEKSLVSKIA